MRDSSISFSRQYFNQIHKRQGNQLGTNSINHQTQMSDNEDSDIEEVVFIPAKSGNNDSSSPTSSYNPPKRRKSSPQLDPIPTYTPTPLYILAQRESRAASLNYANDNLTNQQSNFNYDSITYTPTPIAQLRNYNTADSSSPPSNYADDEVPDPNEYQPLLGPSPIVVGRTVVAKEPDQPKSRSSARCRRTPSTSSATSTNTANAPRPVTGALAEAVARRRNSQQESSTSTTTTSVRKESRTADKRIAPEVPVLWSPQLPSEIEAAKEAELARKKAQEEAELAKYKSPRGPKQRIAHKPNVSPNKKVLMPSGVSKKVPLALRKKYLQVIFEEYLNTGHSEEEAMKESVAQEQSLAGRAATSSIYINLVAGLKKKLREKAGVSTLPPEDNLKYVNGNKVVSHSEIITGKVIGTFSIERKRKVSDPGELSECELYDRLSRYVVPVDDLEAYGYPCRDPEEPELRKVPLGKDGQKQQLRAELAPSYICDRCTKVYRVGEDGKPLPTTGKCIFHPGHLWNERINRALEKRYSCCKGDSSSGGCSSNQYHVHRGELELANYEGYVETVAKPELDKNKHGIYALDCEMCYTTHGLELTRVTVINYKYEVVYERLVKPERPILDYNTKFSGIKAGDLDEVDTSLADVQKDLLKMFSSKTILIGHSLDSDMKALKLFHKHFIDTAQLFPHKRGLPFKRALRTLMVENLRVIIQEDSGHDSKEDASAAFRLVMWKAKTDVPGKAS